MSFTHDPNASQPGPGEPPAGSTDGGALGGPAAGPVEHPEVVRQGEDRNQPNEAVEQPAIDLAAALGARGVAPERFAALRPGEVRTLG